MTTAYTDKDKVKAALAGDTPNFSSLWDTTLGGIATDVSAEIDREVARRRGISAPWSFVADSTATARRFSGMVGGARYLPIDDCVAITSVTHAGTLLVVDVDYVVDPLNGLPITGLRLLDGTWSQTPAAIVAVCKWGFAAAAPGDVVRAATRETIRTHLANRAGNDDRLGMTPFGAVVTSKAFTDLTWRLIHSYARTTGGARA